MVVAFGFDVHKMRIAVGGSGGRRMSGGVGSIGEIANTPAVGRSCSNHNAPARLHRNLKKDYSIIHSFIISEKSN